MRFSKSIFKSKTFWLNILCAALIGIWNYLVPQHQVTMGEGSVIQTIMNIINRFFTDEPVHLV